MATWPSDLPQEVHQDGFNIEAQNGAIRTEMDTGKPFQRQRFTAAVEPFSARIWLTQAQYSIFDTFYRETLGHGALEFDWKHPITGDPATVRFDASSPPRLTALSGDQYQVQMNLEVIP